MIKLNLTYNYYLQHLFAQATQAQPWMNTAQVNVDTMKIFAKSLLKPRLTKTRGCTENTKNKKY